jgi:hypothetical protein
MVSPKEISLFSIIKLGAVMERVESLIIANLNSIFDHAK